MLGAPEQGADNSSTLPGTQHRNARQQIERWGFSNQGADNSKLSFGGSVPTNVGAPLSKVPTARKIEGWGCSSQGADSSSTLRGTNTGMRVVSVSHRKEVQRPSSCTLNPKPQTRNPEPET
jgi:hypothetical protein